MDVSTIFWLVGLFMSSQGEAFFPDNMKINKMTMLANWLFVANAIGNAVAGFVPKRAEDNEVQWAVAAVPAICDILAQSFLLGGIALAGAQTKSILYNSCILWSALLSMVLIGRRLSALQWAGLALLIVGLGVKIDWKKGIADEKASNAMLGAIFILVGSLLHSLTNVVNERFIRRYAISPSKLCSCIGVYSLTLWLICYACGYILPEQKKNDGGEKYWEYHRKAIEYDTLTSSGDAPVMNGASWGLFIVCSAWHAVAYFNLLGSIGVVSCGVMKGLTTAGYVLLSNFIFCSDGERAKYCFNWQTGISSFICVTGVIVYAVATGRAQAESVPARESLAAQEVVVSRFDDAETDEN